MSTSRKEILELLANGKVSADEAAGLLSQSRPDAPPTPEPTEPVKAEKTIAVKSPSSPTYDGKKPTWLHVRVSDLESGKSKVSVNVPLGMLRFGLKIGGRFSPEIEGLDWNEIQEVMNEIQSGILVDVENAEGGEHVQVFVD